MMLLHRSGADLKMKDMTGSTVAHMAASTNSVQSLVAIHDCFGDAEVLSTQAHNGSTPAHIAAVFDNVEVQSTDVTTFDQRCLGLILKHFTHT